MQHMENKLRAALYLEGDLSGQGFADADDGGSMESAIAKSLEEVA